ncbi:MULTISPECIES: hypothetical protein [Streptomyces]|uniref:Uncharacterized protein n=1 Tax=Streptomyces chartreusis NRRL 3882 TaxID=1079985 RepID=A0A2N9B5T0_STRCX|nr:MULTISPECIES: hypothetical protein [Streptomyces]MYS93917.1 hypothetical protein [Streptomyces sp. SID5464]SOR78704.1 hypothetical protein SCNRRL3882_2171 [Streptomyces chartreusis NRRL 3882]
MTEQLPSSVQDFTQTASVAWNDTATRRAWWRQTVRSLLVVGLCAAWWVWYAGTTVAVREQVVLLTIAFFAYSAFGVPLQLLAELPNAWRVRRLLRAHPWQIAEDPPRGVSDHPKARDVSAAWFEVPDPAAPERQVPLISRAPLWWVRRMKPDAPAERRAQIARLWYCGLPGDEVVIAASRAKERAPRRLRHQYLRHSLLPEHAARTDVPLPHPSRSALSHPPTARTVRRRLVRLLIVLVLVWPAVLTMQIAVVAGGDSDKVGLFALALLFEVTLLPFHVFLIVANRRMAGTLAGHPWRLVDCEIRSRGKAQLIHVGDRTLLPPPHTQLGAGVTQLWIAGHPHRRCVVSVPGGARPVRVAMSTTDNTPT